MRPELLRAGWRPIDKTLLATGEISPQNPHTTTGGGAGREVYLASGMVGMR